MTEDADTEVINEHDMTKTEDADTEELSNSIEIDSDGEKEDKKDEEQAVPPLIGDVSQREALTARWFFWNEHNQWQVYNSNDSDALDTAFLQGKVAYSVPSPKPKHSS